jgi:dipeptidyl-peptidase 4
MDTDEFPRQLARTQHFSLGVPRAFTLSPDGTRALFLRTRSGEDRTSCSPPPNRSALGQPELGRRELG